jgi:hypothetical protein
MEEITYFVPADPDEHDGFVPSLRWPVPSGVVRTYVQTYTEPGDMVVVPYCQGPAVVRETLDLERQILALNFDPLLILAIHMVLWPLPAAQMDSAVARLGDSLKQGLPLRSYLNDLYMTTCPACLRPVPAGYFIWERDQSAPVAKYLRCPNCAWEGRAIVEAEDEARLEQIPAKGLHYHYLLDRMAPLSEGNPLRARVESLLGLYSPRNLYALAEITLKIESLFPNGPVHQALKALLLDCLDRCSSLAPVARAQALAPLPGSIARGRGLSRPSRFLEHNVWQAFEEAVIRFQAAAGVPLSDLANTVEAFRSADPQWNGLVAQGQVRDLPRLLAPGSIRLILTSPPPLDSAVWSLSYLWGAWLLGAEALTPLRPLLRQRTPDPLWYARVMAGSFSTLADLLRDDGRLVLVLTGQRPSIIEALVAAASSARMGVTSLVQCDGDYRLELAPTLPQSAVASSSPSPLEIQRAALAATIETIRMRGEPVPWRTVHAAIQWRLAQDGLLVGAAESQADGPLPLDLIAQHVEEALNSPDIQRLVDKAAKEEFWWLADPGQMAPALSDRVEVAAYQALRDNPSVAESDFYKAVYAQFPGSLAPSAALVQTCLQSYGQQISTGFWQLRTEDCAEMRQAEAQAIIEALLALGQRLGYRPQRQPPLDVAWLQGKQIQAIFVVRWRAALSDALALDEQVGEASRYLVIPGGRAALLGYKLANNPVWQQAVETTGWAFVKYRHVRQLVTQPDVDEYALRAIVGLDPIVEQEQAQLPLF